MRVRSRRCSSIDRSRVASLAQKVVCVVPGVEKYKGGRAEESIGKIAFLALGSVRWWGDVEAVAALTERKTLGAKAVRKVLSARRRKLFAAVRLPPGLGDELEGEKIGGTG